MPPTRVKVSSKVFSFCTSMSSEFIHLDKIRLNNLINMDSHRLKSSSRSSQDLKSLLNKLLMKGKLKSFTAIENLRVVLSKQNVKLLSRNNKIPYESFCWSYDLRHAEVNMFF